MNEFLFQLGTGIPFLFVFSLTSAVGYRVRGPLGVTLANAILAAFFAFGSVTRAIGPSLTQHSAASALGVSAICTAVCFAMVYKAVSSIEVASRSHGTFVSVVTMAAVAGGGVALTIGASVLLAGFSLLVAIPYVLPLCWSSLLLAVPGGVMEFRTNNASETELPKTAPNRPSLQPPTAHKTSSAARWNITRRTR